MMKLYSEDYEQCVLGCMLMDNSCIDVVNAILKREYFFIEAYARVFDRISEIYDKEKSVNIVMLSGQTEGIRPDTIASLTDKVATSANAEFYAKDIKTFYLARKLRQMCTENKDSVSNVNVNEALIKFDEAITNMMANSTTNEVDTAVKLTNVFIDELKKAVDFKGQYLGYDTGFNSLNDILDGLPTGKLTVIAARPSIGKTALAVNMMNNIAKKGIPVAIFSLEMSNISLMRRMVSSDTGISSYLMLHGMAQKSMENCKKINIALEKMYSTKISMFDTHNCERDIMSIVSHIRALSKSGTKVFFIDHIGLIKHPSTMMKRYEQVGDITMMLHDLAQNLNVSIVALCQLKRESEGKTPTLADLRESGDIEQNSDICMFLHRDRAQGDELQIPTDLMVIKNRDGQCGTAKLLFLPRYTKFIDVPKENEYTKEKEAIA